MTATVMASTSYSSISLPPTTYAARQPTASAQDGSQTPATAKEVQLARRIEVAELTPNNVGQLRKLNSVVFPVVYSERFYRDALDESVRDICKLGLYNDVAVGCLCCRFERVGTDSVRVYVMTLGVLAPYRRLGIASALLEHTLKVAAPGSTIEVPVTREDHEQHLKDEEEEAKKKKAAATASSAKKKGGGTQAAASADTKGEEKSDAKKKQPPRRTEARKVTTVYLHVQTSNLEAKSFYLARGFEVTGELDEYYKKGVEPRSAWILEKTK